MKFLLLKNGPEHGTCHALGSESNCIRLAGKRICCFDGPAPDICEIAGADDSVVPLGSVVGAVCRYFESAYIFSNLIPDGAEVQVVAGGSGLEGLLDEGLLVKSDFDLVDAFHLSDFAGLDRAFLASQVVESHPYWVAVFRVTIAAAQVLLESATMGYQIGFRILAGPQGPVVARLIRSAGYDDGETDLFLFEGELASGLSVLARI